MQEDVIGTQRTISHIEYVTCSRCGQVTPRQDASLMPGDALEDRSEFAYLCKDCQEALAAGEKDLPTTLA
ncbi:MAG: hypothetical protein OJF49_001315 [Ktedonobacterales bacterium]|nr:MAG: hypothetical protein OJF49_001315 [Ktedonobacterales bacterium]